MLKALLKKDYLMIRKEKGIYFMFFFLAFGISNNGSTYLNASIFVFIPCFTMLNYLTAFDYKYKGEELLACLPLPKKEIVKGRLVFCHLFSFSYYSFVVLLNRILFIFAPGTIKAIETPGIIQTFWLISLYICLILPFFYKWGYSKLRIANMIALGCIVSIYTIAMTLIKEISSENSKSLFGYFIANSGFFLLLFVLIFVILIMIQTKISLKVSEKIMEEKEY